MSFLMIGNCTLLIVKSLGRIGLRKLEYIQGCKFYACLMDFSPSVWGCVYFPKSNFWKDAGEVPKLRIGFQNYEVVSDDFEFECILEMEETCSSLELLDSVMLLYLWRSYGEVCVYPLSIRRLCHRGFCFIRSYKLLLIWNWYLAGFFHERIWLWYIWLFIPHLKESDSPLWEAAIRWFIIWSFLQTLVPCIHWSL